MDFLATYQSLTERFDLPLASSNHPVVDRNKTLNKETKMNLTVTPRELKTLNLALEHLRIDLIEGDGLFRDENLEITTKLKKRCSVLLNLNELHEKEERTRIEEN